jgi:hypothetical protein
MTEPGDRGTKGNTGGAETANSRCAADEVRKAFAGLPLDQKVSTLIQVELDMLGDAVGSVVSAVSKAVDDVAKACEAAERSGSAPQDAGSQGPTS